MGWFVPTRFQYYVQRKQNALGDSINQTAYYVWDSEDFLF